VRTALLLLLLAAPASAAIPKVDYPYNGLTADLDVGASIPAADSVFLRYADPTVKIGIHAGWEFALHKYFLIAPELNLDIIPVNTDENSFHANNIHFNATFTRIRFAVGARLALRFGKAEPFLRLGFGLDHITGNVLPPIGNQRNFSSSAFLFKPAFGFQYEIVKYVVLGVELALPVAGHNFGDVFPYFNALSPANARVVAFTAFDIEVGLFAGFRY
jgi:hypothetical protein